MRRLSRDSWLAIGLVGLLVLITIAAASQQTGPETFPALSSLSSIPEGGKALWLSSQKLGYSVSNEVSDVFQPDEDTSLVLILEPTQQITLDEWRALDTWVEKGGTLVLAGDRFITALAVGHYRFDLAYLENTVATLVTQAPLFVSPPIHSIPVQTRAYFSTTRNDFITHLAVESRPVMLSFKQGDGRVLLSAAPFSFTNAGLKEAGNPALMLNILSAAGRPGVIWFDEWHHGQRSKSTSIVGPGNWLRYTPAGHGLLYMALVVFITLVLTGRRFGRPILPARDMTRRAPLEYITAIANLNRRAGHRPAVLRQYRHQLKRGLGHRYRLDPTLPDDLYLARLAQLNPNIDTAALGRLLAQLSRSQAGEGELVQLAAQVATWLKES